MECYTIAANERDYRANLGEEIMASSPREAVGRYLSLGGGTTGKWPDTSVWMSGPGEPAREVTTGASSGQSFAASPRLHLPNS